MFEHAKRTGYSFSPLCLKLLLMECWQRGLLSSEIVLLSGLEYAAGNNDAKMGFSQDEYGPNKYKAKKLKTPVKGDGVSPR